MTAQHSPVPWEYGPNGNILDAAGKGVCSVYRGARGELAANANRIVACVNACAALKDEEIDTLAHTLRERALFKQQRDELVAALQESRSLLAELYAELGPCDHSVGVCFCDLTRSIESSDAAIAKATG